MKKMGLYSVLVVRVIDFIELITRASKPFSIPVLTKLSCFVHTDTSYRYKLGLKVSNGKEVKIMIVCIQLSTCLSKRRFPLLRC